MKFFELIGMALRTVVSSPMRTMLTMLGVIIGVSSVVTLVSYAQGTSSAVEEQISSLGTNLVVVNLLGAGRATQLDYNELMQFEQFPEFNKVAPVVTRANSNVRYDRTTAAYTVIGTNDRYMEMNKAELESGRFLSESDLVYRSNVVVLGSDVAKKYFGFLDPTGEQIKIDGVVFTVIGKLAPKGKNISGTSIDSTVIMPLETARRQYKLGGISSTYIEAASKDDIDTAQATIEQYLKYKFKLTTSDTSGYYQVLNQNEMVATQNSVSQQMNYLLIGIACISLVVGGIGIMNIMLVTVSERTREIGIRKSIGAKRRSILSQFLVESAVISGLGGIVGLILAYAISTALPYFVESITTKLEPAVAGGAFLFSVVVGVIFGLYPAYKAARLRPIDALRFD